MNTPENSSSTETVHVKMNRISMWMFVKFAVAFAVITFLGNTFAYTVVSYNHLWSKIIGLTEAAAQFCANCLQAIGG